MAAKWPLFPRYSDEVTSVGRIVTPRSAYIHVPFCAHRCGYCDFTLIAGRDDLIGDYLRALEFEMRRTGPDRPELETLFFGGGTPTHPSCEQLREMFRIVDSRFR